MKTSSNILELLNDIESFKVVKCNMYHEKVAMGANQMPISKLLDDTVIFERVSLCHKNERNMRLGCAHSGVNINFERFLENLTETLPQKASHISDVKNEFKEVINKIYALDHRVGYLEHDLAMSQLNSNDSQRTELLTTMTVLKSEHCTLMVQLQDIKSDIEQLIKSELNYTSL